MHVQIWQSNFTFWQSKFAFLEISFEQFEKIYEITKKTMIAPTNSKKHFPIAILHLKKRRTKCKCAWEFDILNSNFDSLNLHSLKSHLSYAQHFMKKRETRKPLQQIPNLHVKCHFFILQIHHAKHGRPHAFLRSVSEFTNSMFAVEMAWKNIGVFWSSFFRMWNCNLHICWCKAVLNITMLPAFTIDNNASSNAKIGFKRRESKTTNGASFGTKTAKHRMKRSWMRNQIYNWHLQDSSKTIFPMCKIRFESVYFALPNACSQMSTIENPNTECESAKCNACNAVFAFKKRIQSKIESANFAFEKPRKAFSTCVLHISKTNEIIHQKCD